MILRDLFENTQLAESESPGEILENFLKFAVKQLQLTKLPKIKFQKTMAKGHPATFGYFDPETDHIVIVLDNRHPMDIMRTLAHELIHYKQRLRRSLKADSGETGSSHENQANAGAGVLMRDFGRQHPEFFQVNEQQVDEITVGMPRTRGTITADNLSLYKEWTKNPDAVFELPHSQGVQLNVKFSRNKQMVFVVATQMLGGQTKFVGQATFMDQIEFWQVGWVWIDEQYSGKHLAARIYKAVGEHFNKIIASDTDQTPQSRAIWQNSLPRLGVNVRLFLPNLGFSSGPTEMAYEHPTRYVLAFDPNDTKPMFEHTLPIVESDSEHWEALKTTGYWGKQAAGCVFLARDTGRFCISHRSEQVLEPGTWGTWGGAIDAGEDPQEAVRREIQEETGYMGKLNLVPLLVFKAPSGSFRYYNFLAIVDKEFEPVMDWETQGYRWVEWGDWPTPLHHGFATLLSDSASANTMKNYSNSSARRGQR